MRKFNLVLALFVSALVLVSCKEAKKAKKGVEDVATKVTETAKKAVSESKEAVVVIEANDAMQYNTKKIVVKAGQTVKLTLKNVGKMAKSAMGHNFVLLKKGTDMAKFATDAMKAKATDYIPAGDLIIVHTKLLGGGEEDTITFEAPEKGEYDFLCSFPGHYAMMKGKFVVE